MSCRSGRERPAVCGAMPSADLLRARPTMDDAKFPELMPPV